MSIQAEIQRFQVQSRAAVDAFVDATLANEIVAWPHGAVPSALMQGAILFSEGEQVGVVVASADPQLTYVVMTYTAVDAR